MGLGPALAHSHPSREVHRPALPPAASRAAQHSPSRPGAWSGLLCARPVHTPQNPRPAAVRGAAKKNTWQRLACAALPASAAATLHTRAPPRMPRPPGPLARAVARARDVVAPRSLPDLPGTAPPRPRRSPLDCVRLVVAGTRDYLDSWRTQAVDDEAAGRGSDDPGAGTASPVDSPSPPLPSPLSTPTDAAAAAARAAVRGAEALRPGLQYLFRSRAAAYRDAVFSFAEGYREGVSGGGGGGGGGQPAAAARPPQPATTRETVPAPPPHAQARPPSAPGS